MADSFPCTSCGLCCKMVGKWIAGAKKMREEGNIPEISPLNEVADFPFAITENGACSQLDENNQCKVYEDRPTICGIESTWLKYHSEGEKSLSDYFFEAADVCNRMIIETKTDTKYLVRI